MKHLRKTNLFTLIFSVPVYRAIAAYDKKSKDLFFAKLTDPNTSGQEMLYLCQAVGEIRDEATLKDVFDITLEKMPKNVRYIPIALGARNETTKPWMWTWYKDHADLLKEKLTPMDLGRVPDRVCFSIWNWQRRRCRGSARKTGYPNA